MAIKYVEFSACATGSATLNAKPTVVTPKTDRLLRWLKQNWKSLLFAANGIAQLVELLIKNLMLCRQPESRGA